jgi:hypothetical protein
MWSLGASSKYFADTSYSKLPRTIENESNHDGIKQKYLVDLHVKLDIYPGWAIIPIPWKCSCVHSHSCGEVVSKLKLGARKFAYRSGSYN